MWSASPRSGDLGIIWYSTFRKRSGNEDANFFPISDNDETHPPASNSRVNLRDVPYSGISIHRVGNWRPFGNATALNAARAILSHIQTYDIRLNQVPPAVGHVFLIVRA